MLPRPGGHVGPPTPLTPEVDRFELMPWRASPPPEESRAENALTHVLPSHNSEQSPQYLGSSCRLTSYTLTLTPRFSCLLLQYQQPLQMPLQPCDPPRRSFQRELRRMQQPYRLVTLSERINSYRPDLPTLQEGETPDQRTNIDIQERPSRIVIKRQGRGYPLYPPSLQVRETPSELMHHTEARSFPRFPHNEWLRSTRTPSELMHHTEARNFPRFPHNEWLRSTRQSHWQQPDAPEIIITSDVQMQTDETGFDSLSVLVHQQSSSTESIDSSDSEVASASTQTDLAINTPSEDTLQPVVTLDVETYPPNNLFENDNTQHIETAESVVAERDSSLSGQGFISTKQSSMNKLLRMLTKVAPLPTLPTASFRARQVAGVVIKHARKNKTINKKAIHCLNCKLVPIKLPVTGPCGHTRCTKCIERHGDCPCGAEAPKELHVNTAIQYLIAKMLPSKASARLNSTAENSASVQDVSVPTSSHTESDTSSEAGQVRARRRRVTPGGVRGNAALITSRLPMSPQVRYEYARRLLAAGRHRDAAPHLARVAASSASGAREARGLLAQIIMLLARSDDLRRVARDLFRAVRLQAASSWLRPGDLECVLCYHTYIRPVTTPCGHVYCRTCIERALDYRKACALCQRPLDDFDLAATCETEFVTAALESIGASQLPLPLDPDFIPIFVCTVAYPSIPCPLLIFDPRYWLMIRRVLESGSRKFGMVAYERDQDYSDYGTILEVCDCVLMEDGRSFLSTVGVSRFSVIERDVRDGCDVARIQPLADITPTCDVVIFDMRCLGSQILYKALLWLNGMNRSVRNEIETAFGAIPRFDDDGDSWWDSPDGPTWLWWLIAILPLRVEIKVLILSTKSLLKRMMAVSRTLDAIDQAAITTTASSECEIRSALTNAEEWLERGS